MPAEGARQRRHEEEEKARPGHCARPRICHRHRFDGCCGEDRKAISELARKWSTLLQSTGMDAAYSIWKDNQISFETKHEEHVKEVTDFLMMQPEAALVRHDLEDSYGPAATQEWIAEHEAAVAEREEKGGEY